MKQYFRYICQERPGIWNPIHHCDSVAQKFYATAGMMLERNQLNYYQHNQHHSELVLRHVLATSVNVARLNITASLKRSTREMVPKFSLCNDVKSTFNLFRFRKIEGVGVTSDTSSLCNQIFNHEQKQQTISTFASSSISLISYNFSVSLLSSNFLFFVSKIFHQIEITKKNRYSSNISVLSTSTLTSAKRVMQYLVQTKYDGFLYYKREIVQLLQ
ncbi:unnamed protein product [Ambrosiozyma monospora]|uniref:Unnamed protein product n=1 Tax=Ambrosiozyma monospora TaxID=43982 RepID=A0ACB5T6G2_AMBMO|nr:unnamed protein product [Ambrosiozyma monospora]